MVGFNHDNRAARKAKENQIKVIQRTIDQGTLVDLIMESVSVYWNDVFMDTVEEFLQGACTDPQLWNEAEKCLELAGDLSNIRSDIEHGKCDEDEEEEYERKCTKLQTRLNKLIAQIK